MPSRRLRRHPRLMCTIGDRRADGSTGVRRRPRRRQKTRQHGFGASRRCAAGASGRASRTRCAVALSSNGSARPEHRQCRPCTSCEAPDVYHGGIRHERMTSRPIRPAPSNHFAGSVGQNPIQPAEAADLHAKSVHLWRFSGPTAILLGGCIEPRVREFVLTHAPSGDAMHGG